VAPNQLLSRTERASEITKLVVVHAISCAPSTGVAHEAMGFLARVYPTYKILRYLTREEIPYELFMQG
jgi:hypothetical protein